MAEDYQPGNWWNTAKNYDNQSDYTFSTSSTDWSQNLLSNSTTEVAESSFHGMFHEDLSTRPFYHPVLPHPSSSSTSPSPSYACSSAPVMHDLLESHATKFRQSLFFDNQHVTDWHSQQMAYGSASNEMQPLSVTETSNRFKSSSSRQQSPMNQLQFTNHTTFWNGASGFYPSFLPPIRPHVFHTNNPSCSSLFINKSSGGEREISNRDPAMKKPRIESPSTMPAKKEKLGDRITALQQLVSPFGKTDRASVLHEAIEYIKLLHDQVSVLCNPYLKTGHPKQQLESGKSKDIEEPRRDLRSRGLCLVPIASTYPIADFWTPNFGRTYM